MVASARHAAAKSPYGVFDAEEPYGYGELSAGQRIGAPLGSRRGRLLLRGSVFVLIVLGGGWALFSGRVPWQQWQQNLQQWLPAEVSALAPALERKMAELTSAPAKLTAPIGSAKLSAADPPPASEPTRPVNRDVPSIQQPSAPAKLDTPPAPPQAVTAHLSTAAVPASETAPAPLPPAVVDPADPYQVRAEAVGLHPGLSRALLTRLSEVDYRNAAVAIKTAVAETPDNGIYVWPRQRKPELAVFHIRFVQGAAHDCRRYVVSIAKDGWSTTALPMERCGADVTKPRRQ
jgi:hypothetical protein